MGSDHLRLDEAKQQCLMAINECNERAIRKHVYLIMSSQLGGGLEICVRERGTVNRGRIFADSAILDLVFHHSTNASDLARHFACARSQVRRARALVAEASLAAQAQCLDTMLLLQSLAEAFSYAVINLRWDETTERLTLPMSNVLSTRQQESSWHVFVHKRSFAKGFVMASMR